MAETEPRQPLPGPSMDVSDAGAGASPSAAEATSTRDDTERKWHRPPRVLLAMALSLSSPAVVSLSRRSLFLGLQKKWAGLISLSIGLT
jgi:hypothetical protein